MSCTYKPTSYFPSTYGAGFDKFAGLTGATETMPTTNTFGGFPGFTGGMESNYGYPTTRFGGNAFGGYESYPWTRYGGNTFGGYESYPWARFGGNTFGGYESYPWTRFGGFGGEQTYGYPWTRFGGFGGEQTYGYPWSRFGGNTFGGYESYPWARFGGNTFGGYESYPWTRFGGMESTYGYPMTRFGGYESYPWSRFGGESTYGYPWSRFGGNTFEYPTTRFGTVERSMLPSSWSLLNDIAGWEKFFLNDFDSSIRTVEKELFNLRKMFDFGTKAKGVEGGKTFSTSMVQLPSRPTSSMEYYSFQNPIRFDANGNRWLSLCFDLPSFKPEEITVTLYSKANPAYIEVLASHDVKEAPKEHTVKRTYERKFFFPADLMLKAEDIAKLELKSHFTNEGCLYVEAMLPRLTAEQMMTLNKTGHGLPAWSVPVKTEKKDL